MAKRSAKLAATGLALGAALSLLGTAQSAPAAAQGVSTTAQAIPAAPGGAQAAPAATADYAATVQVNSNLRAAPYTNSRIWGTTTEESEAGIACYTRAQRVTAGGYTTDVWYFGQVIDYRAGHTYNHVWVWGGNVNVGADPAPGIPAC
ncbi:hypothetical protein [Streptomyces sp. A012304]|uniref:hypothetical protein n=1 Tax=Streptomyces sp. A012304 TaxID=375446 RepID=UPI00222E3C4C|nr:hypothetical protein [Streptomyces sp. A012304]GKQ37428.1 hypothetical protein ALMP_39650 [Streptomyces sp. A012304]